MRSKKTDKASPTTVSIDPNLYQKAMRERIAARDTNFSRYVRELIREDLRRSGVLTPKDISMPRKSTGRST